MDEKKPEAKKAVVTGKVTKQHKSEAKKVVEDIAKVTVEEILWPSLKKIIFDMITSGAGIALFRDPSYRKSLISQGSTPYSKMFSATKATEVKPVQKILYGRYTFDNIVFDNKGSAERVLYEMKNVLSEYPIVTVANLYEFADVDVEQTDYKYGWKNLDNATVVAHYNGQYSLNLPNPMALD